MTIRAVLDTNILVSGLISPSGCPREILRRWRDVDFTLVTSRALVEEVTHVLYLPRIRMRYRLEESDILAFVLALTHHSDFVPGRLTLKGIAPDPGDDAVLACAVEGRADLIVTGDRALQELGQYRGVRIVGAAAFVATLKR